MIREDFNRFLVIYEERSLSRAADRLDAYQGALSKVLAKIEFELGTQLFIRSNRGLVPTEMGQKLYLEIQQQKRSWEEFEQQVSGQALMLSGRYLVGGHESILAQVNSLLAKVLAKYPGLNLEFVLARSPEIVRQVVNHTIDLAFVVNPQPFEELVVRPLKSEGVGLYAKGKGVEADTIVYNPDLISSQSILKKYKGRRLIPVHDYHLVASLAKQMNAAAILPESIAKLHGLKVLMGKPEFVAKICLIYRADRRANKGFNQLLKELA